MPTFVKLIGEIVRVLFCVIIHRRIDIGGEGSALYETGNAIFTVAFESPQRLIREYPASGTTDADGTKVIEVPNAHFWWLAKDTSLGVWGVGEDLLAPGLKKVRATNGIVIRDDGAKLDRVMAGAVARYLTGRGKASGRARGLFLYHLDIGKRVIADDPDVQSILTSVSWTFENGFTTSFQTGFAIK